MNHLPVILLVLLTGCCYVRCGDTVGIGVGTGRRTCACEDGQAVVSHSEIPETLRALAPIAEAAAEGAVRGAIKP